MNIYRIPVLENANLLAAFMEGRLSPSEAKKVEAWIAKNGELAELVQDDIAVDWSDDFEVDFPDEDWDGKDIDLVSMAEVADDGVETESDENEEYTDDEEASDYDETADDETDNLLEFD
ncbi:MAG: hypothetical protein IJ160_00805 [Muribaculaceae bacterium]|nr:hypothetical protein [Muribaculaceae bacterium]